MTGPRLGFLGVGWIGRDRMRAIAESGIADIRFIADTDVRAATQASAESGAAVQGVTELLEHTPLDGLVIATPSALHAEQAVTALKRGVAVFCQKPLGRDAAEVTAVVDAARLSGPLLGVDLSYRHLTATRRMREIILGGDIGEVFAADLVFHNAYGPDKAWFLDPAQSGGGCVIDLGIHLVDLALWMLPAADLSVVSSHLYQAGRTPQQGTVEDYARTTLRTSTGTVLTMTCSWFGHAGRDAVIAASFHGTTGSVTLGNVGGSFYDFTAVLNRRTHTEVLVEPPDAWGGRAAVEWATRLAQGAVNRADELDSLIDVAGVLDEIYATALRSEGEEVGRR